MVHNRDISVTLLRHGDEMLAIANDELERAKPLGKTVLCWMCGRRHKVRYGDRVRNGVLEKSNLLAYFKCKGKPYVCGIAGKEIRPR